MQVFTQATLDRVTSILGERMARGTVNALHELGQPDPVVAIITTALAEMVDGNETALLEWPAEHMTLDGQASMTAREVIERCGLLDQVPAYILVVGIEREF